MRVKFIHHHVLQQFNPNHVLHCSEGYMYVHGNEIIASQKIHLLDYTLHPSPIFVKSPFRQDASKTKLHNSFHMCTTSSYQSGDFTLCKSACLPVQRESKLIMWLYFLAKYQGYSYIYTYVFRSCVNFFPQFGVSTYVAI